MDQLYGEFFLGLSREDAKEYVAKRPEIEILETLYELHGDGNLRTFYNMLKFKNYNFQLVPNVNEVNYLGHWSTNYNTQKGFHINTNSHHLLWSNIEINNLGDLVEHSFKKMDDFNASVNVMTENVKKLIPKIPKDPIDPHKPDEKYVPITDDDILKMPDDDFKTFFNRTMIKLNRTDIINAELNDVTTTIPDKYSQLDVDLPKILNLPNQIRLAYQYYHHSCSFIEASTGFGKSTCIPLVTLAATEFLCRIKKIRNEKRPVHVMMTCPRVNAALNAFERLQTFQKRLCIGQTNKKKFDDFKKKMEENGYKFENNFFHPVDFDENRGRIDVFTDGKGVGYVQSYDALIIDEYHEHNANMEIVLAKYIKTSNERSKKQILTHVSIMTATFSEKKRNVLYNRLRELFRQYGSGPLKNSDPPYTRMPKEKLFHLFFKNYNAASNEVKEEKCKMGKWETFLDKHDGFVGDFKNVLIFKPSESSLRDALKSDFEKIKKTRKHENSLFIGYYAKNTAIGTEIIKNLDKGKHLDILKMPQTDFDKYITKFDKDTVERYYTGNINAVTRVYIYATSIAEASMTFDKLGFVVDDRLGFQTELFEKTFTVPKQKSAIDKNRFEQRRGRVGRKSPGVYIHFGTPMDDTNIDNAPIEYNGLTIEEVMKSIEQGLERDDFVFKPHKDVWDSFSKFQVHTGPSIRNLMSSENRRDNIDVFNRIDDYSSAMLINGFGINFNIERSCKICCRKTSSMYHDESNPLESFCSKHERKNTKKNGTHLDLLQYGEQRFKLNRLRTDFLYDKLKSSLNRSFQEFERDLYNALPLLTYKLCMQYADRKYTLYKSEFIEDSYILVPGKLAIPFIVVVKTDMLEFKRLTNKKYKEYQTFVSRLPGDLVPFKTMMFENRRGIACIGRRLCATTIISFSPAFFPRKMDVPLHISVMSLKNASRKGVDEMAKIYKRFGYGLKSQINNSSLMKKLETEDSGFKSKMVSVREHISIVYFLEGDVMDENIQKNIAIEVATRLTDIKLFSNRTVEWQVNDDLKITSSFMRDIQNLPENIDRLYLKSFRICLLHKNFFLQKLNEGMSIIVENNVLNINNIFKMLNRYIYDIYYFNKGEHDNLIYIQKKEIYVLETFPEEKDNSSPTETLLKEGDRGDTATQTSQWDSIDKENNWGDLPSPDNDSQKGGSIEKKRLPPLENVSFFRIEPSHLANKRLRAQVTRVLKEGFGSHAAARTAIGVGHIGVCLMHENKVVGVVSLAEPGTEVGVYKLGRRVFEQDWYLHDLAVLEEFRGRRVGRKLVEKANQLLEGKVCLVPGDNLDNYYRALGWSAREDGLWVKKNDVE